jgi:hypothetical protein
LNRKEERGERREERGERKIGIGFSGLKEWYLPSCFSSPHCFISSSLQPFITLSLKSPNSPNIVVEMPFVARGHPIVAVQYPRAVETEFRRGPIPNKV